MRFARIVMAVLILLFGTAGFAQVRLEAYLWDASYQSDQQEGDAILQVDGTKVFYEITLSSANNISSAVITRSNEVVPLIDLHASSETNVATGVVSVTAPHANILTAHPRSLVLRIGSVGGGLIGALRYEDGSSAGPTAAFLPLVAHNDGHAGSTWRTDLHLASLTGSGVEITLDYYPMSAEGSALPADSRTVTVGGAGQLVLRDVLGSLFGRDGERGAMRLSAASAFGARARLYDVAPGEGAALAGATSLYSRALELPDVPTAGALLGLSNRTGLSGDGFRTNVILFNPTGNPTTVTLAALADDGGLLGTRTLTVGPYANDVTPVSTLIDSVPPGSLEQASFLVKYFASGPLIVQAAEIDGAAGDGVLIDPVALLGGSPQVATLDGSWLDTMVLVSQSSVTVCGKGVSWHEMDIDGTYPLSISQEGAQVTLCYAVGGGCYEGTLQGNRLVARRTFTNDMSTWCGQHALTADTEETIDVTVESDNLLRGSATWKTTYSGGPQQPVEHVTTVSHLLLRE